MRPGETSIFFYGLFMDKALLASKGVHPAETTVGYVDGYGLRIGERATLIPEPNARTYGLLMTVTRQEVAALYSDESVADYQPEPVLVTGAGDVKLSALCYLLPSDKLAGANPDYAASLLELATGLGFPADYLERIRHAAHQLD